jgi:hypothetical protein
MKKFKVDVRGKSDPKEVTAEDHCIEGENRVFFDAEGNTVFTCKVSDVQSIEVLRAGDGGRVFVPPRPGGSTRGW